MNNTHGINKEIKTTGFQHEREADTYSEIRGKGLKGGGGREESEVGFLFVDKFYNIDYSKMLFSYSD
jgi:hypothetical protein